MRWLLLFTIACSDRALRIPESAPQAVPPASVADLALPAAPGCGGGDCHCVGHDCCLRLCGAATDGVLRCFND